MIFRLSFKLRYQDIILIFFCQAETEGSSFMDYTNKKPPEGGFLLFLTNA